MYVLVKEVETTVHIHTFTHPLCPISIPETDGLSRGISVSIRDPIHLQGGHQIGEEATGHEVVSVPMLPYEGGRVWHCR